jgi:hypothetical protein
MSGKIPLVSHNFPATGGVSRMLPQYIIPPIDGKISTIYVGSPAAKGCGLRREILNLSALAAGELLVLILV